jgi:hypothetical protein
MVEHLPVFFGLLDPDNYLFNDTVSHSRLASIKILLLEVKFL